MCPSCRPSSSWPATTRSHPSSGAVSAVLAGLTHLAFRLSTPLTTVPERVAAAGLFSVFCLTATLAGISLFQLRLNRSGRAWRTLAANSFGIYYVHPVILYPLAWLLVGIAAPINIKVTILVAVTLLASLAVTAFGLRRLPGLRRIF